MISWMKTRLPLFMSMNIENDSTDPESRGDGENSGLALGDGKDDMYGEDTMDV